MIVVLSDINECKEFPCKCPPGTKDCDKIAKCINTIGSYTCSCSDGYSLRRENMCVDRNECFENEKTCPDEFECKNLIGSYKCNCYPGFELEKNGKTCKGKFMTILDFH